MTRKPLTAAGVERAKGPTKGQTDIADGGHTGLYLRVSYGGRKTWQYLYSWHGKQKRMSLGVYPAMSLAEARDAWRDKRDAKDRGKDPAGEGEESAEAENPDADLFETVLARWLAEAHIETTPKTKVAIERMFAFNVAHWTGRPIASITPEDCEKAVYAIADRGKLTMCGRFHSWLDLFFRWAKGVRKIPVNPIEDLPRRGREVKRARILVNQKPNGNIDYTEIALLWRACEAEDKISPMGKIAKLLLLTGCREMEIGALRWDEIHDNAILLVGERCKNGEEHVVPLSPQAMAVLKTVKPIPGCAFVFTVTGTGPFTSWSCGKDRLAKHMKRFDWRIHDLRRTAATVLEILDTPLQVTEAVLNHKGSKKGIVGIYQHAKREAQKRAAVEALGNKIDQIVGGNVLQLPGTQIAA